MKIRTKINAFAYVPIGVGAQVRVVVSALVLRLQLVVTHWIQGKRAHGVHQHLNAPDSPLVLAPATQLPQPLLHVLDLDHFFLILVVEIGLLVRRRLYEAITLVLYML